MCKRAVDTRLKPKQDKRRGANCINLLNLSVSVGSLIIRPPGKSVFANLETLIFCQRFLFSYACRMKPMNEIFVQFRWGLYTKIDLALRGGLFPRRASIPA